MSKRSFISLITIPDLDKQELIRRNSKLLNNILLVLIIVLTFFLPIRLVQLSFHPSFTDILLGSIDIVLVISILLLRANFYMFSAYLAVITSLIGMALISYVGQGVRDVGISTFMVIIIFLLIVWILYLVVLSVIHHILSIL